MIYLLKQILDWSEVWALLIPLFVLYKHKHQPHFFKPVVVYLWLALLINLLSNISWKFKHDFNFPVWFQINTYFYSLHAIARAFLLGFFFIQLRQPFLQKLKKILLALFLIFLIINFISEDFVIVYYDSKGKLTSTLSSLLLSVEAGLMLFYCLQYYVYILLQDEGEIKSISAILDSNRVVRFFGVQFPDLFFLQHDKR